MTALLVVLASLTLAGGLLLRRFDAAAEDEARTRGLVVARGLAASFSTPLASYQHEIVQRQIDQMAELPERFPDIVEAAVLDTSGIVVAHTDSTRFNTPWGEALPADERVRDLPDPAGAGLLEIFVPLETAVRFGSLRLLIHARGRREATRQASQAIVGVLFVTMLVLVVALSLLLNSIVVRPMRRLSAAVADWRIGRTSLGVPPDGPDELRMLVTAFDTMAQRLHEYTGGLEQKVEERTRELRTAYDSLTAANRQLQELAVTDGLTGLANRRAFSERLHLEVERSRRATGPLTLVLFDLDHFKRLNDTLGHLEGDAALVTIARLLQGGRRGVDLVARFGGEEFALLLPETSHADGLVVAERLRAAVEGAGLPGACTISAGVGTLPTHANDARSLILAADQALYAAKGAGRNRVVSAADLPCLPARAGGGA